MMRHTSIVLLFMLLQAIFTNSFFADKCHDYCGLNSSKCLSNGRCLCVFGWTGPNAAYITSGPREGMIVADFCTKQCQYNLLFHNPACVSSSTTINPPTTHPSFRNAAASCEKSCGKSESVGRCLNNNKCLCWWGWTGNNAMYVNEGPYKNRIVADDCMISCHYTHDYRNPDCIKDDQDEAIPTEDMYPDSTQLAVMSPSSNDNSISDIITNPTPNVETSEILPSPSTPGNDFTQSPHSACDPKCERFGQGKCLSDGSCLCWWGWTGPNATYIVTGNWTNRIKAKYCTEPCHYTHDYMNASCATIPTPKACDIPSNFTTQLPCLPRCGAGVFHGECLRNGRCLCWWGWTGPHSCFVDGGDYNNRIIADYCEEPCHYTHDYRNNSCVKSEDVSTATKDGSVSTSSDVTSPAVQSISMAEQPTSTENTPTTVDFNTSQHLVTTDESITLKELSTTEQPIMTAEQSIATEEQPTTAEQPITTEEQSIATEEQLAIVEEQPTKVEQPFTTAEQPIATEEKPTTAQEYPITTEEQASMTEEHPTTTEPQPTTTGEQPISTEEQSIATEEQLGTVEEQPTTEEEQHFTSAEQPITTESQPTTTGEQPITTEEQPTTAQEYPITTEEQASMNEEHPTATESQPTTTGEQHENTEQTQLIEPHDFTESTEPANVAEPSGTEAVENEKSTKATEFPGTTVPTEGRELIGLMEPTEPTEEPDEILLTTQTESSEPKETNRPTEFAEFSEAPELTKATERSEWNGMLIPTEPSKEIETTDWQEWLAATEATKETVLIDPTLPTDSGPTEFTELSEAEETEVTEPTEAEETEVTEPNEVVEPNEMKSRKQTETTEFAKRTDAKEPLESAGPIQPNQPMEPEETNQVAEGSPSLKEQFPAVSSKKHSSAESLSNYMVAFGIIAIVFAMIGLVAMLKHHGKCFKRHLGYRQLGDNTYFVNEREMSDELSNVI